MGLESAHVAPKRCGSRVVEDRYESFGSRGDKMKARRTLTEGERTPNQIGIELIKTTLGTRAGVAIVAIGF